MSEKLQKVLANAGHGSRREIEAMIKEGRVSVDGKLATLGDRVEVTPAMKIRVDGRVVSIRESTESVCRVFGLLQARRRIVYPSRSRRSPNGV